MLHQAPLIALPVPATHFYSYLARMVVERLANGAEFDGVPTQNGRGWRLVSDKEANVERPV